MIFTAPKPYTGAVLKSMNLDYGRQQDLLEIAQAIKNARNTEERQRLEKLAYRITQQTTQMTSLRNELIGATRVGDKGKIKRLLQHIQAVRLDETNGRSWGNNKGNRNINE